MLYAGAVELIREKAGVSKLIEVEEEEDFEDIEDQLKWTDVIPQPSTRPNRNNSVNSAIQSVSYLYRVNDIVPEFTRTRFPKRNHQSQSKIRKSCERLNWKFSKF